MIDQPQFLMPHQHIGIPECTVYIGQKRIQPHDTGRQLSPDLRHCRVEGKSSRQKMQAEVQSPAALQQILDFLITFGSPESFVQIQEDQLGNPETKCTGYLTANQFGYQRFRPVACPTELHDIFKLVISFRQCRQRSTFPKRHDIARHILCS